MLHYTEDEVMGLLNTLNFAVSQLEKSVEVNDPSNPLFYPNAAAHLPEAKRALKRVDSYLAEKHKEAQ